MREIKWVAAGLAALVAVVVLWSAVFIVTETEQVVLTQFGKPVGKPVGNDLRQGTITLESVGQPEARIVSAYIAPQRVMLGDVITVTSVPSRRTADRPKGIMKPRNPTWARWRSCRARAGCPPCGSTTRWTW